MGFLAYQFPNEGMKLFQGKWKLGSLKNLPDDCFFVCDFTKDNWYYFIIEKETEEFKLEKFHFNKDDAVFSVSGRYYLQGLQYFMDGFEENDIEKAIYSRIKLHKKSELNPEIIFRKLSENHHTQALVYLISDEQFGTWIGATPEILVSGNDKQLFSMALAGTKSDDEAEWTDKEYEEHNFVVDFIKDKISLQQPESLTVSATNTVKKGAVYHLQTDFTFKLQFEKLDLFINSIHPTPAVCGTPQDKSMRYILEMEPHDRQFYTGLVGRKNKNTVNIFVNLRCMQILENNYAIYVGGGITKSSDIGDEWRETENKSKTLLQIIEENQNL